MVYSEEIKRTPKQARERKQDKRTNLLTVRKLNTWLSVRDNSTFEIRRGGVKVKQRQKFSYSDCVVTDDRKCGTEI